MLRGRGEDRQELETSLKQFDCSSAISDTHEDKEQYSKNIRGGITLHILKQFSFNSL